MEIKSVALRHGLDKGKMKEGVSLKNVDDNGSAFKQSKERRYKSRLGGE